MEGKVPVNDFEKTVSTAEKYGASKIAMASFCCYDNYDAIATLIITNFHLYLIQLWRKLFPNLCYR